MKTIECQYCDEISIYHLEANFMIFCPKCKRRIYLECEYGYGPVTPCSILLGSEKIGEVVVNDKNQYRLDINGKQTLLKKTYLEALEEATVIIRKMLNPKYLEQKDDLFEMKSKGGFLSFYGDPFGRPGDNFHEVTDCSFHDCLLEILFREGERLIIVGPEGIVNKKHELIIQKAQIIKWSWIPYGCTEKRVQKISYECQDVKVYKKTSHGEQLLEKKSPYAVVMR